MSAGSQTMAGKVLSEHLAGGEMAPGETVEIRVDQVLLHDILGPLIWMEFEAMGFEEVAVDVAAQHCDHNTLQLDLRDTDGHRYLRTAARHYGGHFSKPGNGICHQVHRESWIEPGATLVGCDSHCPTMGGFGAIGMGAGGLDVATAMAGEPYAFEMPEVVEVRLDGELRDWVAAKDVILELLRRLSVRGGVGAVFEFTGPGVGSLSVPERCTIANMATELGATTAIFPSDERTRRHLGRLGREGDFRPLEPDDGAAYDGRLELDLAAVEPLIALPSMPDNVVPVREVAGTPVDQALVGTCTNGSYFDIATVAAVVEGETVAPGTDAIVAPSSKRSIELLARQGLAAGLYEAGVSISESTCGPCIGQGHVPAPDAVSLRAFNRNFEGRSGNPDDSVYLASPEVVAASAVAGEITDPRDADLDPPSVSLPADMTRRNDEILGPDPSVEVERGESIGEIPVREPLGADLAGAVLTKAGDDITTDHIIPGTPEVTALVADPEAAAEYTLGRVDEEFPEKARAAGGGWIVAGENWGQGSSRENAALELAVLDTRGVVAKSFARIHFVNLVNFGLLPLRFVDPGAYDRIEEGDDLAIVGDVAGRIRDGATRLAVAVDGAWEFEAAVDLTAGQRETLLAGGKLAQVRRRT